MLNKARKDNRGFTLVELLLGVTILGIIVVPLLHVFVTGATTATKSRLYGEATVVAQNITEQIQALEMDSVLGDARSVAPGAAFYTLTDSVYTPDGTSSPAISDTLPKTYYLGIKNYSDGASAFDALITLTVPNVTMNSQEVVVASPIETILDMRHADNNAVLELRSACGERMAAISQLTTENLTRSMNVNIVKTVNGTADTYRIEVLFDYSGLITLTAEKDRGNTYPFTYSEQVSSIAPLVPDRKDGSPVFSAGLFYNAYYKTAMTTQTLTINNNTGSDINFFVVNSGTLPAAVGSTTRIWYKNQAFVANKPVSKLIFTNLNNVSYSAWKDPFYIKTLAVSGYLAQTDTRNRKYDIAIKLFKAGDGFSGTPIASLYSTKLSY